jgi:hypothetical protein
MTIEKIITNDDDIRMISEDLNDSIATTPGFLQPVPLLLKVHEQTPPQLINLLTKAHGDIWTLCKRFEGSTQHVVFAIESAMDNAPPEAQVQWNKILELFQRSRMRLVQRKAIAFLEEQEPSEENKQFKDYLAYSKLALNDLFVSAAQLAKKRIDNEEPEDIPLNNILQDFRSAQSDNTPE